MKRLSFMLVLLALTFSCAHDSRDPASYKAENEEAHENHSGLFDRPVN